MTCFVSPCPRNSRRMKKHQRPYLFRTFDSVVRTAKVTVCWPRGDRAPCNGLTFGIAEQPDWHVIADILPYRSFPIRTLSGFGTGSPYHAPAVFWSTPALEQALEISPACSIYIVILKSKHALHDSESARSCNQRNGSRAALPPCPPASQITAPDPQLEQDALQHALEEARPGHGGGDLRLRRPLDDRSPRRGR
jgi:hypothetical protein